jgi:hypothetical protein
MARDLFVASLALGDTRVLGLKRPPQAEGLYSPRLPLNAPREVIFREPRGCVPQDGRRALLQSQHARSWCALQHPLWPVFALKQAISWRRQRRHLGSVPAHALIWGLLWQQPRLARAFSWRRRQRHLRCPLGPAFAHGQALLRWQWRCLEPMPACACIGGFLRQHPQHAQVHSRQQQRWLPKPVPCLALCPGVQCLGLCGGGFYSPTCQFDAGSSFSGSRCAICICIQRCFAWPMHISYCVFNGLCVHLLGHMNRPREYSP